MCVAPVQNCACLPVVRQYVSSETDWSLNLAGATRFCYIIHRPGVDVASALDDGLTWACRVGLDHTVAIDPHHCFVALCILNCDSSTARPLLEDLASRGVRYYLVRRPRREGSGLSSEVPPPNQDLNRI